MNAVRILLLSSLVVSGCAVSGPEVPPPTPPLPNPALPAPSPTHPAPSAKIATQVQPMAPTSMVAIRQALRPGGENLSDDEVLFIHRSLKRSNSPYTTKGLFTYLEWGLSAETKIESGRYFLYVAGAKVNAEWEVFIDKATGEVTDGTVATDAPAPKPPE